VQSSLKCFNPLDIMCECNARCAGNAGTTDVLEMPSGWIYTATGLRHASLSRLSRFCGFVGHLVLERTNTTNDVRLLEDERTKRIES
jgi:hypothetical protein